MSCGVGCKCSLDLAWLWMWHRLEAVAWEPPYTMGAAQKKEKKKKSKDKLGSWIGRINIVIMTTLPKAIYRFNVIPIRIAMSFFIELERINLKFMWKHKRPWLAKTILRKKSEARGIILSNFKAYCKTTIIKTVFMAQKQTHRWMG